LVQIPKLCCAYDFRGIGAKIPLSSFSTEKNTVRDAELLVDDMYYFPALARTDLGRKLNYADRNVVEKPFRACAIRIQRLHEI
jgi:hypothetical protein